jgi:hypothetical protein
VHGAGLVGGAGRALATASARTGAREKVQGHREVSWPAGTPTVFSVTRQYFFPIAPVDFQSIGGGRGGGRVRTFFFLEFFFFSRGLGAGRGKGGEGDPETRGTSCAIPSWNVPKSIFGEGEMEKVSPKVSLDQSIDEKVSPNFYIFKLTEVKKCHQM